MLAQVNALVIQGIMLSLRMIDSNQIVPMRLQKLPHFGRLGITGKPMIYLLVLGYYLIMNRT